VRGYTVLGHRFDVTLEAIVYGGVAGLRLLGLILVCALFSAAVDPDEVLRSLRRVSYRFALTTVLATRLVPVLARDASRRSEAARCRARPAPRRALAHAALAGSLERAVEVAAALEVRGYSRPPARARSWRARARGGTRPVTFGRGGFPARRSRHEARMGASAAALAGVVLVAAATGAAPFEAYPRLEASGGADVVALAVGIVALSIAPFVGSSARLGVDTRGSVPVEAADG
jgi:energy-coupling factor transport system permease protein